MANEKSDISDIVKKCKILLLDIEGTTTSISFVKDKLFPYAEANVKDFLNSEWETDNVKEVVVALRKLALEDEENKVDGFVAIPGEDASKEDQIEGLVNNVKWQMSSDRKVGPLKQLQGLIWKNGYDKGDIKGHVYDDVSPALELWRSVEGQKVYIYSSGSVQAQKLLFGLSSAGDMLKLIDGHFDTAVGAKQDAASYSAIVEKIGCNPEDILFLTDIDREAEAARSAGLQAALVSREGNAPLDEATANSYPVLYSFAELTSTNKRKPDPQEQQPAKILKTDVEADINMSSKNEAQSQAEDGAPQEKPDKMEVDEEMPVKTDSPSINETEEVIKKSETIKVEEITDSNAIVDIPVCVAEPVIVESPEKTEDNKTELMESEAVNSVSEPKENDEHQNDKAISEEETPPAIITEIKDITNDKEVLTDVVEMIDDLVPVIEEPPTQDMEDLENVGDVLAKECDEILSKVQNVTNLDNIPLKPLLNSIPEEVMETENTDSNDIVDKILDTELELEMKQCADIKNSVQEIAEPKETREEIRSKIIETVNIKANVEVDVAEKDSVTTEEIDDNGIPGENVNNTDNTEKPEEMILTVKEIKEDGHTEDTTEKIISTDQKIETNSSKEETLPVEANNSENGPIEEKDKESKPIDDKIEESNPETVQVKESTFTEEKMEENNVTEKHSVSSSAAEENLEATTVSKESVTDDITTEEIVKASSPVDAQVEEVSATNKKAEEEIVTKNTTEETKLQEESNPEIKICETNAPAESKTEDTTMADENITKVEIKKDEEKMETDVSTPKAEDNRPVAEENTSESRLDAQENSINCEKSALESKVTDTDKPSEPLTEKLTETLSEPVTEKLTETPSEPVTESSMEVEQTDTPVETKEKDKVNSDSADIEVKPENTTEESKINGNTSNGDTETVSLNGDANKEEELKSRLSMENGQEVINGANGDTSDGKKAANENNGNDVKEISEVKVKTVAIDEPRNDPIEQPMEA